MQPRSVLGWRAENPVCVSWRGSPCGFTGVVCESMGLSKEPK